MSWRKHCLIYEYFSQEQIAKARAKQKVKKSPAEEQLKLDLRFKPITRSEHLAKLKAD